MNQASRPEVEEFIAQARPWAMLAVLALIGIYLALVTTAAGLCIAIPSILCASYFNTKIEGFFRIIDEALTETFSCFARVEERIVMARPPEVPAQTERERNVDKLMRMT